ncbi:hypothetical protein F3J37_01690 [Pantoea sp. Al-1710]|uniref:Uncharacterized protein n=1 Tax=Candidatus Pantoea communis TaxID=2608354 RepID=A0ABX0RIE0_9GAMM|nr:MULTISPECIES: hypothetical protein [Pantoea]NIG12908.1 hypothetical protein [Pantoea sp. Cy-640]NIG17391.1 hypothetical protein [Pantoea communis]
MLNFTLKLWGNSYALRIPSSIIQQMELNDQMEVEAEMAGKTLMLRAKPEHNPKKTLDEYLAELTPENCELSQEDIEWLNMRPKGKELI